MCRGTVVEEPYVESTHVQRTVVEEKCSIRELHWTSSRHRVDLCVWARCLLGGPVFGKKTTVLQRGPANNGSSSIPPTLKFNVGGAPRVVCKRLKPLIYVFIFVWGGPLCSKISRSLCQSALISNTELLGGRGNTERRYPATVVFFPNTGMRFSIFEFLPGTLRVGRLRVHCPSLLEVKCSTLSSVPSVHTASISYMMDTCPPTARAFSKLSVMHLLHKDRKASVPRNFRGVLNKNNNLLCDSCFSAPKQRAR